jgi:vitamin B12 transporter
MSYGTAFKAPSFNELYYPGFGVPTLKPEESATFEIGLKGSSESNSWSLAYFSTKIDELIGFDAAWNSLNIDRASIRGIEAELKQKLDENWMLAVDFTAVSPLNQSSGVNDGNLLARRPKTSSRVHLDYQASVWSAGATLRHAGTRYDDAANTKKLKAYKTLDLNAQYEISKAWQVQGRIENVFDSNYETAQFYNQPGRGFFVTFRYAMN